MSFRVRAVAPGRGRGRVVVAGGAAGLGVKAYLNEEESEANDLEDEDDAGEDDGEEGDEEAG